MCEFTKIINIGNENSYLYDANINRVSRLPEYISDSDFRFTIEYLNEKKDLYKDLMKKGFFRGLPLNKIDNAEVKNVDVILEKRIDRLILQITQGCNLACKYCFFSDQYNHKKNSVMMEWEVAKRGIDYYIQHAEEVKELKFNFYGGEPLLNFELIEKCVTYIEKKALEVDKECIFSITTNLTILNKKIAEFLEKHHFLLLISLDGPKDVHDRNRKYKNGSDSYETVMANLLYLKNQHPDFFKTITFNAVLTNQEDYISIKNFFIRRHSMFSENNFMISPLYLGIDPQKFALTNRKEGSETRKYIEYLKDNIQRCKELVLSYLFTFDIISVDSEYEERYADRDLVSWLKKFIFLSSIDTLSLSDLGHPSGQCIGGSSRLMLDPQGKFWTCEKINTNISELSIGDIYKGIEADKVKEMLNFSQENEPCYKCWAFRFCGLCVAAVHNTTRENACSCSKNFFQNRLIQYCNLLDINDQYLNVEKTSKCSFEDVCQYLQEKENIHIDYFDYGENVLENSFLLYKILIILKYKFGINYNGLEIINYRNLKSFLKGLCAKKIQE